MADAPPASTSAGVGGNLDPPVFPAEQNDIQKRGSKESSVILKHVKSMIQNGLIRDSVIGDLENLKKVRDAERKQ